MTDSGIAKSLLDALDRRGWLAGRANVGLRRWQRLLVGLASVHPARRVWRERFYKHVLGFDLCSRNSRSLIAGLGGSFDLVVQVFGRFQTFGAPYVLYLDNTHHLSLEHWPRWSPYGARARQAWLARERRTYHGALHIFVTSRPVAESLVSFYGVRDDRVSIVGGGANISPLPRLDHRARQPVVLFVGRDFYRKGGETLVEAFCRLHRDHPEARLRIVGTTEAPSLPGIEVLGRVRQRDQLARLYLEASVFCLPSLFDPYAMVLLEAMAFGLPCVTTTVGALPEIVKDGETGLLVPPGEVAPLAEALARLLNDRPYAERLGAAGRQRVEHALNWDSVVDRMAPVLLRLAGCRGDGRGAEVAAEQPRHGDQLEVGDDEEESRMRWSR